MQPTHQLTLVLLRVFCSNSYIGSCGGNTQNGSITTYYNCLPVLSLVSVYGTYLVSAQIPTTELRRMSSFNLLTIVPCLMCGIV